LGIFLRCRGFACTVPRASSSSQPFISEEFAEFKELQESRRDVPGGTVEIVTC